jgi:hypothetical protein
MSAIPDQQAFGDYAQWPGRDVLDPAGELVGGVVEIYLDDATNLPEWVLVKVGAGTPRFVPLADAKVEADAIRVAQPADRVEAAPAIDPRVELTQNQERELYAHYGLRYSEEESDSGLPAPEPEGAGPAPAARPRLRRYAGPETVAIGEPPPEPAEIPSGQAPSTAPRPAAGKAAAPAAADAATPAPSPTATSRDAAVPTPLTKPSAPRVPPPPPPPASLPETRRPDVPPAAAAGVAAGLLAVLLLLRRRRRR